MWLPWQAAALTSAVLAVVGLAARRRVARDRRHVEAGRRTITPAIAAVATEAALVFLLYAIWQIAGTVSVLKITGAFEHGHWLWDVEQALHLPSEAALQRWVLPYPAVVQAANVYYAVVHVPALIAFLIWLFFRHRGRYASIRNTVALTTGLCLVVQLIPFAPPRLYPELGFVDTAKVYGQSVYGAIGSGISDQLSAMPSVHVAWAVLIGWAVVRVSPSRWRWLILLHPVLTVLVITVTANHWWLDGAVAVAIMALVVLGQALGRAAIARLRDATPTLSVADRPGTVSAAM
jgi:PAP2 superfamily